MHVVNDQWLKYMHSIVNGQHLKISIGQSFDLRLQL